MVRIIFNNLKDFQRHMSGDIDEHLTRMILDEKKTIELERYNGKLRTHVIRKNGDILIKTEIVEVKRP